MPPPADATEAEGDGKKGNVGVYVEVILPMSFDEFDANKQVIETARHNKARLFACTVPVAQGRLSSKQGKEIAVGYVLIHLRTRPHRHNVLKFSSNFREYKLWR